MSLAGKPNLLTGNPAAGTAGIGDLLSEALRRIRITGSMQYCYMPTGEWMTDATPAPYKPADAIGFHIMAAGSCWLEIHGERTTLNKGDIAAFPFGTPHWIGVGEAGRLIDPGGDLPARPWRETPTLHYGDDPRLVRILCGYIQCEAMNFGPFRNTLPGFIHVQNESRAKSDWIRGVVDQIVAEVDAPLRGGSSIMERLTELLFIEVLRRQFLRTDTAQTGWLAAIRDPAIATCLSLIHEAPYRNWTIADLAGNSGLSRSALLTRFATTLRCSPIRYMRDWRLYLSSVDLRLTQKTIATIAHETRYGTESAFNRAFARQFGMPPAEWRRGA